MRIVGSEVRRYTQEGLNRCVRKCNVSLKKISRTERNSGENSDEGSD